jgi:hypothetical protein
MQSKFSKLVESDRDGVILANQLLFAGELRIDELQHFACSRCIAGVTLMVWVTVGIVVFSSSQKLLGDASM